MSGLLLGLCEREGEEERDGWGGRPGGEEKRQLEDLMPKFFISLPFHTFTSRQI